MELIQGQNLIQRMQATGPLPPREAADLVRQLSETLAYVHSQEVLHHDLKPNNVIVTPEGTPVLLDFGLCKAEIEQAQGPFQGTAPNVGLGSFGYLPPEQFGDAANATILSDVFELGGTLYALLVGHQPFQGTDASEIFRATMRPPPAPPSTLQAGIDPDLDAICARCLQAKPEDRYPTAADVAEDLRRFLAGEALAPTPPAFVDDSGEVSLAQALDQLMNESLEEEDSPEAGPSPSQLALVVDAHIDAGDYHAAAEAYQKVPKSRPDDVEVRVRLAYAYRKVGDSVSSIRLFSSVLSQHPNHRGALFGRGSARTDLKNFTGAVEDFQRAYLLHPKGHPRAAKLQRALSHATKRLGSSVFSPFTPEQLEG